MKTYRQILSDLRQNLKTYIQDNNLKSLVLGISGGIDSALVAAIAKPVCDDLNIPLIGVWIEIESNKLEEKDRAFNIGNQFCTLFFFQDLTSEYNVLKRPLLFNISDEYIPEETPYQEKIRLGNVKVRMRMIYLYNLAQRYKGCTLNTDNKTEYNLGFWTIHGDDFDINLLINMWKTEVYELAKEVLKELKVEEKYNAFNDCINAVPTDGLGITSSDVEQFGVKSYDEVDEILKAFIGKDIKEVVEKYGEITVNNVISRHKNSAFKRKLPIDLTTSLE